MNKYSELTDDEINVAIGKIDMPLQHPEASAIKLYNDDFHIFHNGELTDVTSVFDYCYDWEHTGPLITKYGITIARDTCQIHVGSYFFDIDKVSMDHEELLRAICECILLIEDEKAKAHEKNQ